MVQNKCNVGYAFINMTDPLKIIPFFQVCRGPRLWLGLDLGLMHLWNCSRQALQVSL